MLHILWQVLVTAFLFVVVAVVLWSRIQVHAANVNTESERIKCKNMDSLYASERRESDKWWRECNRLGAELRALKRSR